MSAERYDFFEGLKIIAGELFCRPVTRVLTGTITLADTGEPFVQWLDANGAGRTVKMPLETANKGKMMFIFNPAAGAFSLTIQSNAGGALTPATTVAQNKGVLLGCDGTAWFPLLVGA